MRSGRKEDGGEENEWRRKKTRTFFLEFEFRVLLTKQERSDQMPLDEKKMLLIRERRTLTSVVN